jgi:hypothetical protein
MENLQCQVRKVNLYFFFTNMAIWKAFTLTISRVLIKIILQKKDSFKSVVSACDSKINNSATKWQF